MTYLLPLVLLNLTAIGFYMHARMRNDLERVIIFQPGAVMISWLIAASSLLKPDANVAFSLVVLVGMGIAIVGDIEFAIHTYKRRLSIMYGPILYAGGQLLIALSTVAGE